MFWGNWREIPVFSKSPFSNCWDVPAFSGTCFKMMKHFLLGREHTVLTALWEYTHILYKHKFVSVSMARHRISCTEAPTLLMQLIGLLSIWFCWEKKEGMSVVTVTSVTYNAIVILQVLHKLPRYRNTVSIFLISAHIAFRNWQELAKNLQFADLMQLLGVWMQRPAGKHNWETQSEWELVAGLGKVWKVIAWSLLCLCVFVWHGCKFYSAPKCCCLGL